MCDGVCGIETSSLVNDGGKGLSEKRQEKKIDYMYISVYGRKGACVQGIYRYISVYISVYITARGRMLLCSVHSYTPPLTAAIVSDIYTDIYRYIGIQLLRPHTPVA